MEIKTQLFKTAKTCMEQAYAPYSHYRVGASVCSVNDKIFSSCNVENISFPCGICAEAGAISAMIAGGERQIKSILVISEGKDLVYPCGACLQRIAEFATSDTIIYLASPGGIEKEYLLNDLLPHNFTTKELQHD